MAQEFKQTYQAKELAVENLKTLRNHVKNFVEQVQQAPPNHQLSLDLTDFLDDLFTFTANNMALSATALRDSGFFDLFPDLANNEGKIHELFLAAELGKGITQKTKDQRQVILKFDLDQLIQITNKRHKAIGAPSVDRKKMDAMAARFVSFLQG